MRLHWLGAALGIVHPALWRIQAKYTRGRRGNTTPQRVCRPLTAPRHINAQGTRRITTSGRSLEIANHPTLGKPAPSANQRSQDKCHGYRTSSSNPPHPGPVSRLPAQIHGIRRQLPGWEVKTITDQRALRCVNQMHPWAACGPLAPGAKRLIVKSCIGNARDFVKTDLRNVCEGIMESGMTAESCVREAGVW